MVKAADKEVPVPRAAADARGSASGADTGTGTVRTVETSLKQQTDTNVEETLSHLSALAAGSSHFTESVNRLNAKRSYDQAQTTDLLIQTGELKHRQNLDNLALQALQNAIETANMVSKQAVRHSDIAIDRQWNVDEQGYTVAEILRDEAFKDAIAAAVSVAVAEALNRVKV
jgi:hypothetical protein